jgi:sterol desaturase/sphingolipid hydroxylase (fatty acid hydroxylase superfamily)
MFHSISLLSGCIILFGYIIFSSFLQFVYYHSSRLTIKVWKSQSKIPYNSDSLIPWLPILGRRINRALEHTIFATFNLLLATLFAITSTELLLCNKGKMYFDKEHVTNIATLFIEIFTACMIELVFEYIFHRIMHTEFFYKAFHKFHHYYKAPIPFDDMMIHPFEAFLYYCILYSPPFLIPMNPKSHIVYMILMGTCGILDHCGIRLSIPFLYDSVFHDEHHRLFNVNYGFPFSFLDVLLGTYHEKSDNSIKSKTDLTDKKSRSSTRRNISLTR